MENRYIVSFCVPVYNRAEISYKIAKDLLSNTDKRFQVVISDNNSTDNTMELLTTIHDTRLKICRNEKSNSSAFMNWYNALEHGDGEFLYLVMGRDRLYNQNIEKLIELLIQLRDKNIGFARDRENRNRYMIYSGVDAAVNLLDRAHPTGLILNRKMWQGIQNRKAYFYKYPSYPENHIKGELLKVADAALISSGVFSKKGEAYRLYIDYKKDKSKIILDKKDLFIFPHNNLKYLKEITMVINNLKFSNKQKRYIIIQQYKKYLKYGVLNYRASRNNKELCAHYGMKPRTVCKLELIYELIKFHMHYIEFLKNRKMQWYDVECRKALREVTKEGFFKIIEM